MLSLLRKLLQNKPHGGARTKGFQFLICDDKSEASLNSWYRLRKWRSPNFLIMNTTYTKDWKILNAHTSLNGEEEVVGTFIDNRKDAFLIMGDCKDFQIYLDREKNNPKDQNAIKVMALATVDGNKISDQLGYLSKDTAIMLKDEDDIDARPYSVYLPYKDKSLKLFIRVLIRSSRYKKNKNKYN